MEEKSANKLVGRERHGLLLALVAVVLVSEAHLPGFDVQQAIVGDRDPVSIAANVIQYLFRASKWRLGVDHPFRVSQRGQVTCELAGITEMLQRGEELQLTES